MPTDVKTPAESSTAAQEINLASYTPEERQAWRETGELPEPKAKETPSTEESATSKQSSEAGDKPAGKASPASEAGKKTQEPHRDTAEDRKTQLNAEIRELLKRRDTLKAEEAGNKDVKPAEPSPAKTAEAPKGLEPPKKPKLEDFQNWDEYDAAKDKYYEDMADHKAQMALQKDRAERAQAEQQKELAGKLADARKRYGDADAVIAPTAKSVFEDQAIAPAVKQLVNDSPVLIDLLYVLGSKAEDLAEFTELARTNPGAAIRKVVLLEHLVQEELSGAKAKPEAKAAETPEKPVTRAPKPPAEVGGRGTSTEDEGLAAVRSGDMRTAKAVWDRQYAARHK